MCGIVGIFAPRGVPVGVDEQDVAVMRDRLARRGPDGLGTWFAPSPRRDAVLAHRRLAVLEPPPSHAGVQPMISACGRYVLVYNGELYNDADIRRELAREGAHFYTHCDTETVLGALMAWGESALSRFRGMFALALYDYAEHALLLARDPLGIKPLYYAQAPARNGEQAGEFIFASEIPAILAHPRCSAKPDPVTVSAYLSTIRTTLGRRTLYAGVGTLLPGEVLRITSDAARGLVIDQRPPITLPSYAHETVPPDGDIPAGALGRLRELIGESVRLHLRSDVPTCCLLSGGLDSSIITAEAVKGHTGLRTFCAGSRESQFEPGSDLDVARRVAERLGTRHSEALLTQPQFVERWAWMVDRLGVPLGTPNEVAIYEVAACLRSGERGQGCVVTLSGEGADELFAGYDTALLAIADVSTRAPTLHPGAAHLAATAWNPPPSSGGAGAQSVKPAVLTERFWSEAEHDEHLVGHYCDQFETAWMACADEEGDASARPLSAHQQLLRRINLTGLLQRLDTSMMLAGVEGRTPFADAHVTAYAESLPMRWKCVLPGLNDGRGTGVPPVRGRGDAQALTKRILRSAYADVVPREAIERPKASFPLPFQRWATAAAGWLAPEHTRGGFLEEIIRPNILAEVRADPARHWQWTWPLINLAMWAKRFA